LATLAAASGLLAACGAQVPPSVSERPCDRHAEPTTAPSVDTKFSRMAYPDDGDAPCGQDKAPDAKHGPYRGNLKRIEAKDPTDRGLRAVRARCRLPLEDRRTSVRHQRHRVAAVAPRRRRRRAADRDRGQRHGPYRLERWDHGTEISLARNESYWGTPTRNERVIVRWRDSPSERVIELQGATVDGVDQLDGPASRPSRRTSTSSSSRGPGMNTVYLGFTDSFNPFDDERVRRALAMAIDRQKLVDTFLPPGSERADFVTPCAIPNGCSGNAWYGYDPLLAKELLTAAGFPDGFATTIHYPDSSAGSSPDLAGIANEVKGELLDNLGITAEVVPEPAQTYAADVEAGKIDGLHLASQSGSFPDVSGFLDPQFASSSKEFGKPLPDVTKALSDGRGSPNPGTRASAYGKANSLIRDHAPSSRSAMPDRRVRSSATSRARPPHRSGWSGSPG
jgi:hypothetical protein